MDENMVNEAGNIMDTIAEAANNGTIESTVINPGYSTGDAVVAGAAGGLVVTLGVIIVPKVVKFIQNVRKNKKDKADVVDKESFKVLQEEEVEDVDEEESNN